MTRRLLTLGAVIALALLETSGTARGQSAAASWLQWGGPTRNFMSDSKGLASSWPAGGPKKLWSRALGEGHSSILVEDGRLYTMYRPLSDVAAGAAQPGGSRRRTRRRPAARRSGSSSTPLPSPASISRRAPGRTRLRSSSATACSRRARASELFALDKATGKRIWAHDFVKEYRAVRRGRGYTCSPLFYNGLVIVTRGRTRARRWRRSIQQTGALVWKAGDFEMAPASPILIDVDGQRSSSCSAASVSPGWIPRTAARSGPIRTRPTGA